MTDVTEQAPPRRIGIPLMIGIYVAPVIFCWLLLRRGYASSTRVAAFAYAAMALALGVVRATS